jgi:hypothetical protein
MLGQNRLKNGYYALCSSISGYFLKFEITFFAQRKVNFFNKETQREKGGSHPSHSLSDLSQTHDFAVT